MIKVKSCIGEIAKKVFIVAHNENVIELEQSLRNEGFIVEIIRGPYTNEQKHYSAQVKCLVNHGNVWQRITDEAKAVLIVEADFVPVVGLSKLPMPCPNPEEIPNGMFSYLYTCGPIIYGGDDSGHIFGHSASTVAYMADARTAHHLLSFLRMRLNSLEKGKYTAWDTNMGVYLRKNCGILNYFPVRNYGEHGGSVNKEHLNRGYRRNWHRADMLVSRLAFYPAYSRSNFLDYFKKRFTGWFWGIGRLLLLRLYDPRFINEEANSVSRGELLKIALLRSLWGTILGRPKS